MTEKNVELVRRVTEALSRNDIDAAVGFTTSDIRYHEDPHWLDGREFSGRDELAGIFREYGEVWGTRSLTVEWVEPIGELQVIAGIRQRGVTPQGEAPIDQVWTYLFKLNEGSISEMWAFADEDEGRRKAAELAPQSSR